MVKKHCSDKITIDARFSNQDTALKVKITNERFILVGHHGNTLTLTYQNTKRGES